MIKKKIILFTLTLIISFFCNAQELGYATYYNNNLKGHHTSDGSKYDPDSMTCAHRSYPLGTLLMVNNPKNDRFVIVKVTDRGPFQKRLMIDLSYTASAKLDIIREGIAQVKIFKLDLPLVAYLYLPTPLTLLKIEERIIMESVLKKYLEKCHF
ncbi:MAG: septal ring lytic transglycosylase RlpA family protein [Paludibacter sp.]|nr:septal ring lytic transglycosylase RlpA family protein [Paludibacter sp.]